MEGKDLHRRNLTSGGATGDGATLHPLEAAPRKWKKLSPSFEPPRLEENLEMVQSGLFYCLTM